MKITNCPAYSCNGVCSADLELYCKDYHSCLLKQIVELCNGIIEQRQEIDFDNIWGHSYSDSELSELNGRCKMARKILNLLEIEEVNE